MPTVAVHLLAGVVLAFLLALTDVALGRVSPWIPVASATDVGKAALLLAAMVMPLGALLAVSIDLISSALRPLPWFVRTRDVLVHPSRWFAADPSAFGWLLSILLVSPLLLVFLWRAAFHFATRYHNPELAAGAMAVVALLLFVIAAVVVSALHPAFRVLGDRMGRVASVGAVVLLACGGLVAAGFFVWQERRDLFSVIDVRGVALTLGALVLYPVLLAGCRRVVTTPRRRVLVTSAVLLVVSAALASAAVAYSNSHRVRSIVERETSFGITLLHRYAALSDTDGDGYSFLFGGGDCNDGDPNVHPGAVETPADGVDSNCMGGDTDPDVADFGDGDYAATSPMLGRPNFLVITVDALRPDRLGAYNPAQKNVSPNIDAFAREATRFQTAYSPSSRSIRSIPSIWIGAYPSQIAFGPEHLWPTLLPENVTAVELLSQHGYQTAASIGTNYFSNMPNFFQGFGQVVESRSYKPSRSEATTRAIGLLDKLVAKNRPWLMWVHLFNVHEPYLHDGTTSKFGEGRTGAYDTEVSLADAQVARLLAWLKERGVADQTVVVLASDHGEAFLEHGTIGHSYSLYNEELLSTLLIRVPMTEPRVVHEPVSLIDIAPTLLNLAGVPLSRPSPARSLLGAVKGQVTQQPRALYAELLPDGSLPYDEKSVVLDGWKLILWVREGSIQLFDLRDDPRERRDLSDTRRDKARQLHDLLRGWVTQTHLGQHRRDEVLERHRLSVPPRQLTQQLNADYGPFVLLGYDLQSRSLHRGETLNLDLYFHVRKETRDDYFFEVSFSGPSGFAMPRYLNAAHYPLNGAYRTYEWREGEILRDPVRVKIPDVTSPVSLDMRMRIIRRGRTRITLQAPGTKDGWLSLGTISIVK